VRGMLENMYECKREHGNAVARIGITGGGVAPNYWIEFQHKEPPLDFSGFKVGIVGVFDGRNHKIIQRIDDMAAFLGQIRQVRKRGADS
jgi:hypothetical protein